MELLGEKLGDTFKIGRKFTQKQKRRDSEINVAIKLYNQRKKEIDVSQVQQKSRKIKKLSKNIILAKRLVGGSFWNGNATSGSGKDQATDAHGKSDSNKSKTETISSSDDSSIDDVPN